MQDEDGEYLQAELRATRKLRGACTTELFQWKVATKHEGCQESAAHEENHPKTIERVKKFDRPRFAGVWSRGVATDCTSRMILSICDMLVCSLDDRLFHIKPLPLSSLSFDHGEVHRAIFQSLGHTH